MTCAAPIASHNHGGTLKLLTNFNPDNGGRSLTTDEVPEAARKSAVFAVTLEPAGGVQSPTGAIYLRGEL